MTRYNLKTREFETFGSLSDFTSIDHNYCLMKDIQFVKVGFLNVCNLKSKICLVIPEFQQLVEKFDLFGCCETKLDNLDTINLSNFKCICSNRVTTRNKSGGVCLFVSDLFTKHYKVIICSEHCGDCKTLCSSTNDMLWCIIGDVLFEIMYIPPESSDYYDVDIFAKISLNILELGSLHNVHSVCLLGDFNARTNTLQDSIVLDESFLQNSILPDHVNDLLRT